MCKWARILFLRFCVVNRNLVDSDRGFIKNARRRCREWSFFFKEDRECARSTERSTRTDALIPACGLERASLTGQAILEALAGELARAFAFLAMQRSRAMKKIKEQFRFRGHE
jgi:hypothetical protein